MLKGQTSYVNFMVFSLETVKWQLIFSLENEIAVLRLITAELSNRDNTEFAKWLHLKVVRKVHLCA